MGTILLVILILLLVGALPTWPHSANWGYFPSGGLGLVLLVLVVLLLTGRI
jgi:hypothetical protein